LGHVYELIKDFTSPVVTLSAAIVAGLITITFARIQANIAESQRDIALDRLKFDLFQRRYDIYEAAKQLIEHMLPDLLTASNQPRSCAVTVNKGSGRRRKRFARAFGWTTASRVQHMAWNRTVTTRWPYEEWAWTPQPGA
jgi:hypothetical protein